MTSVLRLQSETVMVTAPKNIFIGTDPYPYGIRILSLNRWNQYSSIAVVTQREILESSVTDVASEQNVQIMQIFQLLIFNITRIIRRKAGKMI